MTEPSMTPTYVFLEDRSTLAINGPEARTFLQGIISNDIEKVTSTQAIHAALLTAQGKYLHDFFIVEHEGALLVDCENARRDDLLRRLSMYKLRADATISDQSENFITAAIFGDNTEALFELDGQSGNAQSFQNGVAFIDPRHVDMGIRAILPRNTAEQTLNNLNITRSTLQNYDTRRLALGIPDSSRDMIIEKSILLENGFDELHGVDWNKGCYIGQELTARTKHRGLIKKRLIPVLIDGSPPDSGTIIRWDDKDAGEMRSSIDGIGLALMRLEYLEKAKQAGKPFIVGDAKLTPQIPEWIKF
ncbi:MAG: CAF17-like 4Fe-4S cluster assembly/insertion protein YgfZ [Rhodospirillales bacterium]|jgi:folate-binding protein YgfZ